MPDLTRSQSLTLSRLTRFARWTELDRTSELVHLKGSNGVKDENFWFSLVDLTDLMKAGLVECAVSQRIQEVSYTGRQSEVSVRYWRVL